MEEAPFNIPQTMFLPESALKEHIRIVLRFIFQPEKSQIHSPFLLPVQLVNFLPKLSWQDLLDQMLD